MPLGRLMIGLAVLTLIVAAVLAGHAVEAGRPDAATLNDVRVAATAAVPPQAAALERCRSSGPASAEDPVCQAAWSEARQRFFARPLPEPSDE